MHIGRISKKNRGSTEATLPVTVHPQFATSELYRPSYYVIRHTDRHHLKCLLSAIPVTNTHLFMDFFWQRHYSA
jgi:hypothetical protein